ncbi:MULTISPECIES: RagB/SusD family nutrient uptake outer membrane protein [Butyricimonas]|uniref:RagB/SusD family nutrient uptake outer membrane protein n=1 Tax=Butyricimonas TaxID=574697 RepID=UPI001D08D2C0|nr:MULTISPECIES: RagB/SusD family nutrient uptake outer membrane protein [Butyricimonas]MCB6974717.1 RagB/SusD family nutrient uptake outer membrane protein [Butyricimonas synergistica]MCG4521429.1 RagB/SusD family nutrient uptake outer membrane protein [Butyricimonas sp. DFI.6.44]
MKNFRLLLIFALFYGFYGCTDALTVTPENSLTYENGLTLPQDFESLLNRIDQMMFSTYGKNYETEATWWKGEYADSWNEANEGINGARTLDYPSEFLSMNKGSWNWYYRSIVASNIVLTYVEYADFGKELRDLYRGQALYYKAYAYLQIIRTWGDCMLIENDLEFAPKEKSKWEEVADYAIDLSREAITLLPDFDKIRMSGGKVPAYKNTPCRGTANALLAHLCAWKAGGIYFANSTYETQKLWEEAEKACTAIIGSETGVATGVYRLAVNPEEVVTKVLVGNSEESILELPQKEFPEEFSPMLVVGTEYLGYPVEPNWPLMYTRYKALHLKSVSMKMMYPIGDKRREAYLYNLDKPTVDEEASGFAFLNKYRIANLVTGADANIIFNGFKSNYVIWRLADIYLLRAECRVRLGNNTGAIADLNEIRRRAGAKDYEASDHNGDLRYTIFKEREKELLAEGHRYHDVIRNGYAKTELEGKYQTATDQDFKDGAFFMMIDDAAFNQNPLLRQNAYWYKKL